MAIVGADSVLAVTYKFNHPYGDESCGFSEIRFFPNSGNEAADKAKAYKLAQLRLRTIPRSGTMVQAKMVDWARRGRARKVIPGPLDGVWPPSTRATFSGVTISLAPASPDPAAGVDNTNIVTETADLLKVENPSETVNFRIEGEAAVAITLQMHLIPDMFVSELTNLDTPSDIAWVDSASNPTEPDVNVASGNYWTNFKDYFTYMKKFCVIVKPWEATSGNTTPKAYNLHPIDGVFFERISKRDVGRPSNLPRGRVLIA